MSEMTNFLGIPVYGDITHGESRTAQRPLSDLEPLIRAVLDDAAIDSFGWTQYTPYFNDGDPCVFRVDETWVNTSGNGEDNFELWNHPTLSIWLWDPTQRTYVPVERDAETIESYNKVNALDEAIQSGAFNDVLLKAFGDHADITVRRTGITVNYYSHD